MQSATAFALGREYLLLRQARCGPSVSPLAVPGGSPAPWAYSRRGGAWPAAEPCPGVCSAAASRPCHLPDIHGQSTQTAGLRLQARRGSRRMAQIYVGRRGRANMAARELGAERQGPSASTSAVAALVQEGRSSSEGATEEAVHELDEDADASRPGGEEATGPVIIRVRECADGSVIFDFGDAAELPEQDPLDAFVRGAASAESPASSPPENLSESTLENPTESPLESLLESALESPTESSVESPTETASESLTESAIESLTESASESLTESAPESSTESATESATDSSTESLPETPPEVTPASTALQASQGAKGTEGDLLVAADAASSNVTVSGESGSVVESEGPSLRLNSGGASLPHPAKVQKGGEDAFFCAEIGNSSYVGVSDGVGGWATLGIDAGLYSRELMYHCQRLAGDNILPRSMLIRAHKMTKATGSATVMVARLRGNRLRVANLGDSGFLLVRDGQVALASTQMQHAFNFPFQIGSKGGDDPDTAKDYEVDVERGDLLVLGTDGLHDNLFEKEIAEAAAMLKSKGATPQLASQQIAAFAQQRSVLKGGLSPFAVQADAAGYEHQGGKPDDITVVVAYVE